jgi:hypothetical protein
MALLVGETVQDRNLKAIRFFGGSLIATTVSWLDFSAAPWNGDSKLRDPITLLTMSFAS